MTTAEQQACVRKPAVAGLFYDANADALRSEVGRFVGTARKTDIVPRAIIVPHAGYQYSGAVAGSGFRALSNIDETIETVYLLGPAHRVYTKGVAAPSHDSFATPLGDIRIDRKAIERLVDIFDFVGISDESHADEHSLEVQLPFLQKVLHGARLVPLVVGEIHPQKLKVLVDHVWNEPHSLLIVSSDLSHFHGYEEACLIDARTANCIEGLQWQEMRPDLACGFIPVSALLISAAEHGYHVTALDVKNSGDTAGTRDRVVGYGSFVVHENAVAIGEKDQRRLLVLARDAITHRLSNNGSLPLNLEDWPVQLRHQAATFVTLTRHGKLRGCIGNLEAEEPMVISVSNNACRAAFNDPRFPPLSGRELEEIDISVSILSPSVPMQFTSEIELRAMLRPGIDGLILSCGHHRGTFLPSVWESLPEPRDFLESLKSKAGLAPDFWSDEIVIERYTTQCFGEQG